MSLFHREVSTFPGNSAEKLLTSLKMFFCHRVSEPLSKFQKRMVLSEEQVRKVPDGRQALWSSNSGYTYNPREQGDTAMAGGDGLLHLGENLS